MKIGIRVILSMSIFAQILIGCELSDSNTKSVNNGNSSNLPILTKTAAGAGLVDVTLRKLFRYSSSRPDHMAQLDTVPINGYLNEGLHWYILPTNSAAPGIGTYGVNIFRLYKSGDHMTSSVMGEGGYTSEFQIGKLLNINDADVGLYPIRRYRKLWTVNSISYLNHLDAAFGESLPSDYVFEQILGYGWIAKGQQIYTEQKQIDYASKSNISDLKIGASFAWGGSFVSLIKNGTEYVNRFDAGREIQSAFFYDGTKDNPNEAGDLFGNGSPIINYDVWNGIGEIRTRVNALRWGDGDPLVVNANTPVLSGTEIGKHIKIINANRIEYKSWFILGKPTYSAVPAFEEVTAYLRVTSR